MKCTLLERLERMCALNVMLMEFADHALITPRSCGSILNPSLKRNIEAAFEKIMVKFPVAHQVFEILCAIAEKEYKHFAERRTSR